MNRLTFPSRIADKTRSADGLEVGMTCNSPSSKMRKACGIRRDSKIDLIEDVVLKLRTK